MAQKVTMMMMMMMVVLTLSLGAKAQTDPGVFVSVLNDIFSCVRSNCDGLPTTPQTCLNAITTLSMEAQNASMPIGQAICAFIRLLSQTLPVPIPDDAPILGFCAASPQPIDSYNNLPGGEE